MANKQPIDYVLPGRAMGWENIKTRGGAKEKKNPLKTMLWTRHENIGRLLNLRGQVSSTQFENFYGKQCNL